MKAFEDHVKDAARVYGDQMYIELKKVYANWQKGWPNGSDMMVRIMKILDGIDGGSRYQRASRAQRPHPQRPATPRAGRNAGKD